MDFKLTDEQLEFQQNCRKFAEEVIRPLADKYDREQTVPVGGHQGRARVGPSRPGAHHGAWATTPTACSA